MGATEEEINKKRWREPNVHVLVFGVPESKEPNGERRRRNDEQAIVRLMTYGCRMNMDLARDVEGHKQLGKYDQTKTRPLLVRFRESEKKKELFSGLKNLKTHNEDLQQIKVQNDLTIKERDRYKKLQEEAKRKTESGNSG